MSDGGTGGPGQMWPGKEMTAASADAEMRAAWAEALELTGEAMTDTPGLTAEQDMIIALTNTIVDLRRELAEARKDAERLVEALEVVSGSRTGPREFRSNSEWASYVLQMRDAARREHGQG